MTRVFSDAFQDFLHTDYSTMLNRPTVRRLSRNKVPIILLYAMLNPNYKKFIT